MLFLGRWAHRPTKTIIKSDAGGLAAVTYCLVYYLCNDSIASYSLSLVNVSFFTEATSHLPFNCNVDVVFIISCCIPFLILHPAIIVPIVRSGNGHHVQPLWPWPLFQLNCCPEKVCLMLRYTLLTCFCMSSTSYLPLPRIVSTF